MGETWEMIEERKRRPVSRMDMDVYVALQQEGYEVEFQKEFCVQSTTLDVWVKRTPKGKLVDMKVYVDGPHHKKPHREMKDVELRDKLKKYYGGEIVSLPYERYSKKALREILKQIRDKAEEM